MTPEVRNIVSTQLAVDEGKRQFPYVDTVGKVSIGIGRNLTDCGLSADEIAYLFQNDVAKAENTARLILTPPVFEALTPNRQAVLINMAFNLGMTKLCKFRNMLRAVKESRYADAAQEMRASIWADQVGQRADRLATLMEHG